jgi:hypothetical protein
MATKIQTLLIDDLDGGPAERTVRFALDGQDYETELSVPHLLELTQSLSPYIGAARTVANGNGRGKGKRGRKTPGRAVPPPSPGRAPETVLAAPDVHVDRDAIRTWAQAERPDLEVKDRGRVSAAAVAAYNAARGLQ